MFLEIIIVKLTIIMGVPNIKWIIIGHSTQEKLESRTLPYSFLYNFLYLFIEEHLNS